MTSAERHRIFRPREILRRLDAQESLFLKETLKFSAIQLESLRIQVKRGTQPRSLILDKRIVQSMAQELVRSLIGTYWMGLSAINYEIIEAKAIHRGKQVVFATPGGVPWQEFTPMRGLDWYRDYSLRIVGVQQQDALEKAKEVISRGIDEGVSGRELQARLGDVFVGFSKSRLENIARTETAKIFEQSRWQAFQADDEIVGYEWSAILDSRVCPICSARHGRIIRKGQGDGNFPPAHWKCRCVSLPIFAWEIESGEAAWKPIPPGAPPITPGFGTTHMRIPEVDRVTKRLIS